MKTFIKAIKTATMSNPTAYLLYPLVLMTHEQRTEVMKDLINRGLAIDATKQ